MPSCELCGKEALLVVAEIEGGEVEVCPGCAKYGVVKRRAGKPQVLPQPLPKPEEPEYGIVADYALLIRSARELKGMTQEDFAKLLSEKESILAKWEAGTLKPSIETARKLEKKLGIRLIELDETISVKLDKGRSDELTLGDFVKVRKRK